MTLNLSGNQFCEEGGAILGPSITANDSIEILDLSWNQIRRRGALAIAAGLKVCTLHYDALYCIASAKYS